MISYHDSYFNFTNSSSTTNKHLLLFSVNINWDKVKQYSSVTIINYREVLTRFLLLRMCNKQLFTRDALLLVQNVQIKLFVVLKNVLLTTLKISLQAFVRLQQLQIELSFRKILWLNCQSLGSIIIICLCQI